MKHLSTPEVAQLVGVHTVTLERWLASRVIPSPERLQVGGRSVRLWTARDIERVKRHKAESYRKGRGRKKQSES
jgi:excisionase family DNA binding protein